MSPALVFIASYFGLWGLLLLVVSIVGLAQWSGYGAAFGAFTVLAILLGFPIFLAYAIASTDTP